MKLKVEYVPIDSIKPYEKNAKLHPDYQIDQIKKSMEELGNLDPIGIWHGEIVEGHGRYEAAKQLGYKDVPVIRLDDLTDEQRKAYGLIHNQLTMNSGFDFEKLEEELADLQNTEIDMSDFGFTVKDIDFSSDDDEFKEFDDSIPTKHKCPKCGYEW